MSTTASPYALERRDLRTILTGGVSLGMVTIVAVVIFALVSRSISGRSEVIFQSLMVLVGGALAMFLPANAIRPRSVDGIGWTALTGFLGAVVFAVADIAILRPISLYSWTWDAIGGGSGWWYIPVWWMGATFLAWMGGLVYASRARATTDVNVSALGLQAAGLAVVIFGVLAATGLAPFHAAVAALAFGISAIIQVPVAALLNRR
ncbi:MAG: hypothetical protein HY700_09270 [Gemmatimonadetes bacterium]|nr:hypothetical protein [Gemmatimonadota bacterium]